MEKVDFKVLYKDLYQPRRGVFSEVRIPKLTYLMVDGTGDPESSEEYHAAIGILYTLSFTLKFQSKKGLDRDYTVPPLEGLWWAEDIADFANDQRANWKWTAMMLLPSWITPAMMREGVRAASERSPELDFSKVRKESLAEGLCVQTMFVGPYAAEAPVIAELHGTYLPAHGLVPNGKHHEVYLSDPRRVAPDKLKTIIRQPVKKSRGS
jgi:hypothetical protein